MIRSQISNGWERFQVLAAVELIEDTCSVVPVSFGYQLKLCIAP